MAFGSVNLRPYQTEAIGSIFKFFREKDGNPIVAMPTGTGKSHVIAGFIHSVCMLDPRHRFLMLTHRQELIAQNAEKLKQHWATAPLGIFSAGLKQKQAHAQIVFGGVQSVAPLFRPYVKSYNPEALGHRDLLLVDECHLVSQSTETSYRVVIEGLQKVNPYLRVIGFSATPWRLGLGHLTKGGIFTDTAFDICTRERYVELVDAGYLSDLISRPANIQVDMEGVEIKQGEYAAKQTEERVVQVLHDALRELCLFGFQERRQSWMVFVAGIKNAERAADILRGFGVTAMASHSMLSPAENEQILKDFKSGKITALVGADKYTTGFDHPPLDLIGMLRPTKSSSLHVQMLGRGGRPYQGKRNCRVLDFAGNLERLGPINDPVIPKKKGDGGGIAPIKICPNCGEFNHASATQCAYCGFIFPRDFNLSAGAASLAVIQREPVPREIWDVNLVYYASYAFDSASAPKFKVSYTCSQGAASELISFGSGNSMAQRKASGWWIDCAGTAPPKSAAEALARQGELRPAKRIEIERNGRYPAVLGSYYD